MNNQEVVEMPFSLIVSPVEVRSVQISDEEVMRGIVTEITDSQQGVVSIVSFRNEGRPVMMMTINRDPSTASFYSIKDDDWAWAKDQSLLELHQKAVGDYISTVLVANGKVNGDEVEGILNAPMTEQEKQAQRNGLPNAQVSEVEGDGGQYDALLGRYNSKHFDA